MIRLLLAGGGTAGSVSPLLAVWDSLQERGDSVATFVGTRHGPERPFVEAHGLPFEEIESGKFRRYWNFQNVSDVARVIRGFVQARRLIRRLRPDACLFAGSFVSVPVGLAAATLRLPFLLIQLDLRPTLSNRILAPFATAVAVGYEPLRAAFGRKGFVTGVPVRPSIRAAHAERGRAFLGVDRMTPILLVMGGSTGAQALNDLVGETLDDLTAIGHVVHITGSTRRSVNASDRRYSSFPFLGRELPDVIAAADVVVSRGGIGTVSELAALGKSTVIIPLPGTSQEANADFLRSSGAAVTLPPQPSPREFLEAIQQLMTDSSKRETIGTAIRSIDRPDAAATIAVRIRSLIRA